MNAINTLKANAAQRDTDTLIGALLLLEAKSVLSNEERMVMAATSDAITERHGISAMLDEVFDDLAFTGTYADAILLCLAKAAA